MFAFEINNCQTARFGFCNATPKVCEVGWRKSQKQTCIYREMSNSFLIIFPDFTSMLQLLHILTHIHTHTHTAVLCMQNLNLTLALACTLWCFWRRMRSHSHFVQPHMQPLLQRTHAPKIFPRWDQFFRPCNTFMWE